MADEVIVEKPGFALEWGDTQRGFGVARFSDVCGNECSIQESSSVLPRLWLGIDKPVRPEGRLYGVSDAEYAFLCAKTFRMHLAKSQALAIGRAMIEWAESQPDVVFKDEAE